MLNDVGRSIHVVFEFQVPNRQQLIDRMLKRAAEENRPDDTPEVIAKRLETYHAETEPIVEHYRLTGRLVPLRAERTIAEVYAEIQDALATVNENA